MKKVLIIIFLLSTLNIFAKNLPKIDMSEYNNLFLEISQKRLGIEQSNLIKIHNPFFMQIIASDSNTSQTTAAEIVYTLYAIFGNRVKINDKWYKLNDKIGYYTLKKIKQSSVLLVSASDKKELFLRNDNAKNIQFSSK